MNVADFLAARLRPIPDQHSVEGGVTGAMRIVHSADASRVVPSSTAPASYSERASGLSFGFVGKCATEPVTAFGHIAPYAAAGATWWVEAMGWWRGDLATARDRITAGPPA